LHGNFENFGQWISVDLVCFIKIPVFPEYIEKFEVQPKYSLTNRSKAVITTGFAIKEIFIVPERAVAGPT
jgi:hypothetical protein